MSLVIWQKDKSQNGGNKKTKHAKFFEKQIFFNHGKAHVCFLHKKEMIAFWKIWCALFCYLCFEIHLFALLPMKSLFRKYIASCWVAFNIFFTKRKAISSKQNNLQYCNTLTQDLRNCFLLERWGVAGNFLVSICNMVNRQKTNCISCCPILYLPATDGKGLGLKTFLKSCYSLLVLFVELFLNLSTSEVSFCGLQQCQILVLKLQVFKRRNWSNLLGTI